MTKKEEQSIATRRKLLRVARELFAGRGYADTSVEEIVRRAKVTRGALYHHFADKRELFQAVHDELNDELADRLSRAADVEPRRPELHLELGSQAFLDACLEPEIQRIMLTDAPSVLGAFADEVEQPHRELIALALHAAMAAGYLRRQPVEPLAELLLGALHQAGIRLARSPNPRAARKELVEAVAGLIDGLKA